MEDNYSKAYKEIVEILKYVPEESVNKIPKEMRDMFEAEQLKTYNFQIDTEKPFEEQELLEETKAILANIFRDYWATDYQRQRILAKEANDIRKEEEAQQRMYNAENLFKNKKKNKGSSDLLPAEVKEDNIFKKIINKIKRIFSREG